MSFCKVKDRRLHHVEYELVTKAVCEVPAMACDSGCKVAGKGWLILCYKKNALLVFTTGSALKRMLNFVLYK